MHARIFTVGHSTHPVAEFLALLNGNGIELLADVRRFPGSRRLPQFNQENLAKSVSESGIRYEWFEALGGRRPKSKTATGKNLGLRNESFRNYADYMLTPEFHAGIDQLLKVADETPTAILCSEGLFWRCHRRLISDFLLMKGIAARHIMPDGELQAHALTAGAKIGAGEVTYPAAPPDRTKRLFE